MVLVAVLVLDEKRVDCKSAQADSSLRKKPGGKRKWFQSSIREVRTFGPPGELCVKTVGGSLCGCASELLFFSLLLSSI